MLKKVPQYFLLFLQLCCALAIVHGIHYLMQQKSWSPIDEYAHMDYIEKLTLGHVPAISDTLCYEILQDIVQHPERSAAGHSQNVADMGLALYSYQAKHPPVYYLLLSVPDRILQFFQCDIFQRVQILRIVTFILYAAGTLLIWPVFFQLRKGHAAIPHFFPWLVVLFSLLVYSHARYGLGNNALSPLFINGSLLLVLVFMNNNQVRFLLAATLLSTLSCCVALSNFLLLPFIILLIAYLHVAKFGTRFWWLHILLILPSVLILISWKLLSVPDETTGGMINQLLSTYIPAGMVNYFTCLRLLWDDLFTLHLFGYATNIGPAMALLLIGSLLAILLKIRRLQEEPWLLFCLFIVLVFFAAVFFLNRTFDSVTWVAYRHYTGLTGILFTVIFSGLLLWFKPRNSSKNHAHPD